MSDAFTNFLGGVATGIFDSSADLKDYQHASRLYVDNTYARAPKTGFLYFVSFDINSAAISNSKWKNSGLSDIGLLVKRVDMPKFGIETETINQYNRKTVVQTKIKYNPITIDFHDDNSNITLGLWKNYYNYYYADGKTASTYTDTKYGTTDYAYGLNNNQNSGAFFNKIHLYVMSQGKFTKITLINPMVTEWAHDGLDQADATKILSNKMTVAYEAVKYEQGVISKNSEAREFTALYYDNSPSPLRVAGNGSLFGVGGALSGAADVFGSLSDGDYLGAVLQGADLAKSVSQLSKDGLAQEGYSILKGVLGDISKTGNQPGSTGYDIKTAINSGIGVGVKLFQNSSVSGQTTGKPNTTTGS